MQKKIFDSIIEENAHYSITRVQSRTSEKR